MSYSDGYRYRGPAHPTRGYRPPYAARPFPKHSRSFPTPPYVLAPRPRYPGAEMHFGQAPNTPNVYRLPPHPVPNSSMFECFQNRYQEHCHFTRPPRFSPHQSERNSNMKHQDPYNNVAFQANQQSTQQHGLIQNRQQNKKSNTGPKHRFHNKKRQVHHKIDGGKSEDAEELDGNGQISSQKVPLMYYFTVY